MFAARRPPTVAWARLAGAFLPSPEATSFAPSMAQARGAVAGGGRCLGHLARWRELRACETNRRPLHASRAAPQNGTTAGADRGPATSGAGDGRPAPPETLLVARPSAHVAHLQLHRPKSRNAFSFQSAGELSHALQQLDDDPQVRCLVLSGSGRDLTSGVDLRSFMELYSRLQELPDFGRRAKLVRRTVQTFQQPFKCMHQMSKPIVCVAHGLCFGLGVELAACSDIRYASADLQMAIREVLIGIAADVGSLQLLPRLTSNQSLLRELIYTGRVMTADEVLQLGLVSRLESSKELALEAALETAHNIAKRSPVAVQGSKQNLRFSENQPLDVGLDYNAVWNMSMLQSDDVVKAVGAIFGSAETNQEEPFDDF